MKLFIRPETYQKYYRQGISVLSLTILKRKHFSVTTTLKNWFQLEYRLKTGISPYWFLVIAQVVLATTLFHHISVQKQKQ